MFKAINLMSALVPMLTTSTPIITSTSEQYEIHYNYATNEVDNTNIQTTQNSLVSGNIYMLTAGSNTTGVLEMYFDSNIDNILVSYDTTQIDIEEGSTLPIPNMPFDYLTFDGYNPDRYYISGDDAEGVRLFSLYIRNTSTFEVHFYCVLIDVEHIQLDNDIVQITACPQDKIPYTLEAKKKNNIYNLFYDLFKDKVFNNDTLDAMSSEVLGQTINMASWLSHICTIVVMLTLVGLAFLLFRWIFRVFSGLVSRV